jgi:phosphatidylglycerophosphate synthase
MPDTDAEGYRYSQSLKSDSSDELINTYVLRPIAGVLVRFLYNTSVTPNQITVLAILVGGCAAVLYSVGEARTTFLAGVLVTLKDLLDSADGQLARAKNQFSRRGRFIDSIGDFLVDLLIFAAITAALHRVTQSPSVVLLGIAGMLGITLRVSYHVFYHVSFLHLGERYQTNRLIEEIRDEDRRGDKLTLRLQQVFLLIYLWQDRLMFTIDGWSKSAARSLSNEKRHAFEKPWYSDRIGLRLSGFLGFGTELALLTVCSLLNELSLYLWLNLLLMNSIWLISILYRRLVLAPALVKSSDSSSK